MRRMSSDERRGPTPVYTHDMFRRAAVLLILALAIACTARPEPEGPRIDSAEDFFHSLDEAGVDVVETARTPSRTDPPGGRVVSLGGEQVEVYNLESEAAQRSALEEILESSEPPQNLWGQARLIVIYDGRDGPTIALLSGLLGDSRTLSGPVPDEPFPPAVVLAIAWAADQAEQDPESIVVESFEAAQWPDACLGLSAAGEACAAVVTPGWRITLDVAGRRVDLRTDELGSQVRPED